MGSRACRATYVESLLIDRSPERIEALRQPLLDVINPEVWDPSNKDIVRGITWQMPFRPFKPLKRKNRPCDASGQQAWPEPEPYQYHCTAQWVLEHGRPWHGRALRPDMPMGEPKACFYNSLIIGVYKLGLTYVEGYEGSADIAYPHAWNVDSAGRVIDLTPRPYNRHYYGVAFSASFVTKTVAARGGVTGVLDNYQQRFPLLRNDDLLEEALHPAFRRDASCSAASKAAPDGRI